VGAACVMSRGALASAAAGGCGAFLAPPFPPTHACVCAVLCVDVPISPIPRQVFMRSFAKVTVLAAVAAVALGAYCSGKVCLSACCPLHARGGLLDPVAGACGAVLVSTPPSPSPARPTELCV
jgi:hypothetical protein